MKLNLDYRQLAALMAVAREGSFEAAAQALAITPSALSQRIKALEQRVGGVLLTRARPSAVTPLGAPLLRHAQHVALLEQGLFGASSRKGAEPVEIRIAVNADSLATWFLPAVAPLASGGLLLDLRVDDEGHTQQALRQGEVLAAVCAVASPVQGCRSERLGAMRYRACASPAFAARHFAAGLSAAALARAPCLRFNAKDELQLRWLRRLTRRDLHPPTHRLPSSTAFVQACEAGIGWGLQPELLVAEALRSGRLVDLAPQQPIDVVLHWHSSRLPLPGLAELGDALRRCAREQLRA